MARICFKFTFFVLFTLMLVNIGMCDQKTKQIVCIGDDITKGVWREELVGNGTRWTDVLSSYDKNIEVVNAGISGLKAGNVSYLNGVLDEYPNASMYIIYLGVNDIKRIKKLDSGAAASVGAKVLRMVNTIKSRVPKAEVVIVAPQRVSEENLSEEMVESGLGEQTPVLSDLLSASLEVVSKKTGARFVDLLNEVTPEMLPDGVNPNVQGHAKIAELIWKEITHPYEEATKIDAVAIAPPPVGSPESDEVATEVVVEGVTKDMLDLQGVGSNVEVHSKVAYPSKARSKKYINSQLSKGVVSKPAYELGKSVASSLIGSVESSMVMSVDAIMEAQLSNLDSINEELENTSKIAYKLPEQSRVESYITGVNSQRNNYEVLADVVDWNGIEVKAESNDIVKKDVVSDASGEPIVDQEQVVAQAHNIDKLTEKDIVENNNDIVELWLPEFDVLEGTQKAVEVVAASDIDEAEELSQKINSTEVEEVYAAAEPIEYTGYAVFIHTGINE